MLGAALHAMTHQADVHTAIAHKQVCLMHLDVRAQPAATPVRQSLLESLDDSDDDFGGPPPLLSPAVVPQPVQADAASDAATWQLHWLAASSMADRNTFVERQSGSAADDAAHSSGELRQRGRKDPDTVLRGQPPREWLCTLQTAPPTPEFEMLVTA